MSPSDTSQKNDGRISFHDYIVTVCFLDAEWTRQRTNQPGKDQPAHITPRQTSLSETVAYSFSPFLDVQRDYTTKCCKYRDDINRNYELYGAVRDRRGQGSGIVRDTCESLQGFLFNPAFYFPFGHADVMAVTLLDDFDPFHAITAHAKTTVEDACLGFCPTLSSLGLSAESKLFVELHDFFGMKHQPVKRDDGQYEPSTYSFQQQMPLLAFTRYRMDGLAALSGGILFQQNLYKAMAKRVEETVDSLRAYACLPQAQMLMHPQHVDNCRVAFLDLQGPEEIGTFIFCQNYSVAMSLVCSIRSLTLEDVLKIDETGQLKRTLRLSPLYKKVSQVAGQALDSTLSSHVFRWTESSVAVASEAFLDKAFPHCDGLAAATSGFQISPGHRLRASAAFSRIHCCPRIRPRSLFLKYIDTMSVPSILHIKSSRPTRSQRTLFHSNRCFRQSNPTSVCFSQEVRDGGHGRDIMDIATHLVIPVPDVPAECCSVRKWPPRNDIPPEHTDILTQLLPDLRRLLCYAPVKEIQGSKTKAGRLNLERLNTLPRQCGVPVALRRTIDHLYQEFASLLADSSMFDFVIDLYDVFATLHAVLTEHLLKARCRETGRSPEAPFGPLDQSRIEQLAMLAGAIQNALAHRTVKVYPQSRIRDMATDFRGGLNQVLLAADAVAKASLGLLRKHTLVERQGSGRERVGVTTNVSSVPGAGCYVLKLGTEDDATLGFYEVDVPHVLHPPSYCDYLHESFHLVFDAFDYQSSGRKDQSLQFLGTVGSDRASEIFANLMVLILLFEGDKDNFVRYQVCNYSNSASQRH